MKVMSRPRRKILVDALSVSGGGGRSYAINLVRELRRDDRGLDFSILLASDTLEDLELGPIEPIRINLPGTSRPGLRTAARLLYEQISVPLGGRRFDAVYAVADLLSPLPTAPTVVALRNLNIYDHTYYGGARLRVLRSLAGLGARRATRVIFPTRAAADAISPGLKIPDERIRIVPHGVDASVFESSDPFVSSRPYLFLPSAIEKHKNLEILVEALPMLRDDTLEVRVAGSWETDPAYHAKLAERAEELDVADRFIMMGPVPYLQIGALYRGARALVFPSLLETFGHPILEAMALETPVLASDIPTFLEVGGGVARYFERDDPAALARAVDALGDANDLDRRIESGRNHAREFSWERSTDRLCEVLDEASGLG